MSIPSHECAHPPCTCEVPLDRTYCSDACSEHAAHAAPRQRCDCGHAGCGETPRPAAGEPREPA